MPPEADWTIDLSEALEANIKSSREEAFTRLLIRFREEEGGPEKTVSAEVPDRKMLGTSGRR